MTAPQPEDTGGSRLARGTGRWGREPVASRSPATTAASLSPAACGAPKRHRGPVHRRTPAPRPRCHLRQVSQQLSLPPVPSAALPRFSPLFSTATLPPDAPAGQGRARPGRAGSFPASPPPAALRRGGQHPPYSSPPWCPGPGCPQPRGEAGSCRRRVGVSSPPPSLSLSLFLSPGCPRERCGKGGERRKGMASGAARSQLAPGNRGRSAGSCRPDASALRQGGVGGATAAPGTCRAAEPAASGGGGAGQPRCAATAPPPRLRRREGRRPTEGGAAHLPLASMRSRRPARGGGRAPAAGSAGFQDGGGRPARVRRRRRGCCGMRKSVFFFPSFSSREQVRDASRQPLPWSSRVWCVHTGLRWLKRGFPPSPQAPQRVAPRDEADPASGCAPSPRGATSPHLRAFPQRWGRGAGSPPGLGGSQPRC